MTCSSREGKPGPWESLKTDDECLHLEVNTRWSKWAFRAEPNIIERGFPSFVLFPRKKCKCRSTFSSASSEWSGLFPVKEGPSLQRCPSNASPTTTTTQKGLSFENWTWKHEAFALESCFSSTGFFYSGQSKTLLHAHWVVLFTVFWQCRHIFIISLKKRMEKRRTFIEGHTHTLID